MGTYNSKVAAGVQSKYFDDFKKELPQMTGKTVAITGTTSGTGHIAALTVGELNAENIILLNRPSERSTASHEKISAAASNSTVTSIDCDLMDFDSVDAAIEQIKSKFTQIDVLCNNAGIMAMEDKATKQGYDIQMQVNHLSHFKLTKGLYPLLQKAAEVNGEARVVNHSSGARFGKKLQAKYLQKEGGKLGGNGNSMLFGGARWVRYQQTKLANGVFTYAFHDKLQASGSKIKSLFAHPGLATTNLQLTTMGKGGMGQGWFTALFMKFAQSAEDGTMGILKCMCATDAQSGDFWSPGGTGRLGNGIPVRIDPEDLCNNQESKDLLWKCSEEACGTFEV